jgi:hypothetical protein
VEICDPFRSFKAFLTSLLVRPNPATGYLSVAPTNRAPKVPRSFAFLDLDHCLLPYGINSLKVEPRAGVWVVSVCEHRSG